MAKEHKVTKSVAFPTKLLDEIEWLIEPNNPKGKDWNFSLAVLKLVGIGMILMKQEGKIETGELLEQMNGLIKDEKIMFWLQSLSDSQREGLGAMIDMINKGQQTRL